MKRSWERTLALLLALGLLLGLSGCSGLDQMRERQAFYDVGKIVCGDATYEILPECEYLCPNYDYGSDALVYVTDRDVPVLLSSAFCLDKLWISEDGAFLYSINNNRTYCKVELYDSVIQRIKEGFSAEVVCYAYEYYDEQTDKVTSQYYALTQEQVDAVTQVLETVEPMTIGSSWHQDYDYSVQMEECSADMLFRRVTAALSVSEGVYYLTQDVDGQNSLVYTMPNTYNFVFAQILSAYVVAYGDWNASWQ